MESIGKVLRYWRVLNKKSQMDLAFDVDISPKHLSFVETGKSKPSRDLVLRIAQALKLPLRHRNVCLMAAGYKPEFREEPFDGIKMSFVREAIHQLIENHNPYPAFVINTAYKILMKNSGYDQFVSFYAGDMALKKYDNAMRLIFEQDGLRPYIKEWSAIQQFLLARLEDEVMVTQNSELLALLKEILLLRSDEKNTNLKMDSELPILSLTLEKNSQQASFFTTIITFGTPLDLTTQELRIELLFPSNEETKKLFPLEKKHLKHMA